MRYFVNLPISWVHKDYRWFELFQERHINAELGFDERSLNLPAAWHRELASRFEPNGLICAVHLPFFGPAPGQADKKARLQGLEVLKKAVDVANIYGARHLVGHPSFFAHSDAESRKVHEGDIGPRPAPWWLENSVESWLEVLSVTDAPLYLENTHDTGPEAVISLLEELQAQGHGARSGMCFDIGHWFSFAQGCDRHNLGDWLEKISPYIRHLHLHDNRGHSDEHLGLGKGRIPLDEFFIFLRESRIFPTFTLEPHDLASFEHSSAWLVCNRTVGEWMRADGEGGNAG